MLVTGENGAGKTNLLESLHVGTQGFSPRSRMDAQLVRNGATRSRIQLAGERVGVPTTVEVTLGSLLKYREDQERVLSHGVADLVRTAILRGA